MVRKNLNQENSVDYQRKRTNAIEVVETAKRNAYKQSIGGEIKLKNEVWTMIRKMSGETSVQLPVLTDINAIA